MARTVIEESGTPPMRADDGPGLGLVVGFLLGLVLVVLTVLFFAGVFDNDTSNSPVPDDNNPGASAPAEPTSEPTSESSP